MKRGMRGVVAGVAMVVPGLAAADGGVPLPIGFSQLCVSDRAQGLRWESGRYRPANFNQESYIFEKLEPSRLTPRETLKCDPGVETSERDFKWYKTCVRVSRLGDESFVVDCDEVHFFKDSQWEVSLDCVDRVGLSSLFRLQPNGPFHHAFVHGDFSRDPGARKADMYVMAGRCGPVTAGATAPTPDRGLVQKIQSALAAKGYSPGPADGVMGPSTRSAIRAFQRSLGLPETGQASAELLMLLNAGGRN